MSMESRWPSPVIYLNKDEILGQNSTDRMCNNPRALCFQKSPQNTEYLDVFVSLRDLCSICQYMSWFGEGR